MKKAHEPWLREVLPRHERLVTATASLLENILKERNIGFLSVEGRTKDIESALEKIRRKKYRKPETQLTDLSGLRVITYLESQVADTVAVIRELFDVDEKK